MIAPDVIDRLAAMKCKAEEFHGLGPFDGEDREPEPCRPCLARALKEERIQKKAVRRQGVLRWGEEHKRAERLERALREIMRMDGVGADLSPAGPCYEVARRALGERPTRHEPNAEVEA